MKYLFAVLISLITVFPVYGYETADNEKLHAWSKEETEVLRSLWIGSLPPPPKDPSNAYYDNPRAAALGEKFFFEKRFSRNGQISCGTCHMKEYSFTEDMPRAHGMGPTVRRTQPIIGMAYLSWFFWDGRADSLWAQALGPPENPNEHGVTRTLCAGIISRHYKQEYEEVFGPMPDLPEDVCIPSARPDPDDKEAYRAWMAIPPEKQEEITRVYVNMGKAIAAYERLIMPGPAKFDKYVEALIRNDRVKMAQTLDKIEVEGLRLFIGKAGCVRCHSGPLFTDGEFHRIGVHQPAELPPDTGRSEGIKKVLSSEFNCLSRYSDATGESCQKLKALEKATAKFENAFKTPTLRNIEERPPYMHAGQFWNSWEVLRFFSRVKPSGDMSNKLYYGGLSEDEMIRLEDFLHSLSSPLVVRHH